MSTNTAASRRLMYKPLAELFTKARETKAAGIGRSEFARNKKLDYKLVSNVEQQGCFGDDKIDQLAAAYGIKADEIRKVKAECATKVERNRKRRQTRKKAAGKPAAPAQPAAPTPASQAATGAATIPEDKKPKVPAAVETAPSTALTSVGTPPKKTPEASQVSDSMSTLELLTTIGRLSVEETQVLCKIEEALGSPLTPTLLERLVKHMRK